MSAQIAVADPALRIGAQASRRVTLDAEAIRDPGSGIRSVDRADDARAGLPMADPGY